MSDARGIPGLIREMWTDPGFYAGVGVLTAGALASAAIVSGTDALLVYVTGIFAGELADKAIKRHTRADL